MADRSPTRPLPNLSELDTAEFWRGTQANEFRYQQCANCDTIVWHPRAHCTGCVNGDLEWRVSAGAGVVYTFSVVRQSYHPFFRSQVPYIVALVDLDEGPRFLTNITGTTPEEMDVGMRVQIVWEEHEEVHIPLAKPM